MTALLTWIDQAVARLDQGSARVARALFSLSVYVLLPALVGLVTLDVGLRYVFNAPLQWGRDANGLLLLMTLFAALPHAWDRAYHIRMEVLYLRFPDRRRRQVDVLTSVIGIIIFALMAVQAGRFVPFMMATGETGEDLDLPLWPYMAFVSVCASVMVARVFSNPTGTGDPS